MAKFCGAIGFVETKELRPGVWMPNVVERTYYGDLNRNSRNIESTQQVNDSINVYNDISILADAYAHENFHNMRYVIFMGHKWKIRTINVQYPRLQLTLGGLYNEQED